MKKSIQRIRSREAIPIYYLGSFLINFVGSLTFAIYTIFLNRNGLDYFQMNLINTIFMIAIVILQVPTGAIADHIGRKKAVLIASGVAVVGYLSYAVSSGFYGFAVAEILIAVSMAFSKGAFEAWMVDTSKTQGFTGKFDYVFSQAGIYSKFASILGGLIGAFLATINISLPFYTGAFIALFVFLILQKLMIDDSKSQKYSIKDSFAELIVIAKTASIFSIRHKVLIWVICGGAFISFCSQPLNMYWSIKFNQMFSEKLEIMGYIWALMTLFALLGTKIAKDLLGKNFDYSRIVTIGVVVIVPSILLSSNINIAVASLAGFLIHEVGRGMFSPIQLAYVNKFAPDEQRATMMSFESMISALGAAIGLIFFGLIAKNFGINTTWMISAVSFLLVLIFYFQADRATKIESK